MDSSRRFTRASQLCAEKVHPQLRQPLRVALSISGNKQHGHATMGIRQMAFQTVRPPSRKNAKPMARLEQRLLLIVKTLISVMTTLAARMVSAPTRVMV
jgi:hypothetical protein